MTMNPLSSHESEAAPPAIAEEGTARNRGGVDGKVRESGRVRGRRRQRGRRGRRGACIVRMDGMEVQKQVLRQQKILWSLRCLFQVSKANRRPYND